MIQQALQYLTETCGGRYPAVRDVHEDSTHKMLLVVKNPSDEGQIVEYAKEPPTRKHMFGTLDGLLAYLNSHHCKDDHGVVFVQTNSVCDEIHVDLNYCDHRREFVRLELTPSEEWSALQKLLNGINQRDLWRMLISDLSGCFDHEMLLSVGQMRVTGKIEGEVQIDTTGITNDSHTSVLEVTFPGNKQAEQRSAKLRTDWTFTGRVWDCFDQEFPLELRVELDNSFKFTFHPKRLRRHLRQAQAALVENIRKQLPENFTVYEGSY